MVRNHISFVVNSYSLPRRVFDPNADDIVVLGINQLEMTAVKKNIRWGVSACVAALALALGSGVASAQQKAPDAPAKADVKKAEPPKAEAKKAEAPKAAPVKKAEPKKAASACAGVEPEATCIGNTECMWVKEVTTKAGQKRKAHCQKKPTPPAAKKAAEPKKAEPAKAAPAAVPKAAAPAPAAPKAAAPVAPKQ